MLVAALTFAIQPDTSPHTKVDVAASVIQAVPGRPFTVGVRFQLEPGWHCYWQNPGDSGSPTVIGWKPPKGWKVIAAPFPYPERIDTAGIISYGYEKEATFLYTVIPPADAKDTTLKGTANWLVCREQCLMANTGLSLDVRFGDKPEESPEAARLATAKQFLPKVSAAFRASITSRWSAKNEPGYSLQIRIFQNSELGPDYSGASLYFYPEDAATLDHAAPQSLRLMHIITGGISLGYIDGTLTKSTYASTPSKRLRGVLVAKPTSPDSPQPTRAFLIDAPVTLAKKK